MIVAAAIGGMEEERRAAWSEICHLDNKI